MHYLCLTSCLEVNQPEMIMFHYKHEPWGEWWDRIRPSLHLNKIEPDRFMATFQYTDAKLNQYRYAHLADIARLEILVKYGGVYTDIDTIFINRFPEHFYKHPFVMGREKVDWNSETAKQAGGSLCNAVIMSKPNAPFAKLWLAKTYECFDGSWCGHSTHLPFKLSKEHPDLIHIEDECSFFAFDWTQAGIRDIFKRPLKSSAGIYSIHLWSHLWWERDRTDFSIFHAGRLTPEYVRFSNSTYATLARRFLPAEILLRKSHFFVQQFKAFKENIGFALQKK